MALSLLNSTKVDAQLVEVSSSNPPSIDTVLFNVILVPEIESSVQKWTEPGRTPWFVALFDGIGRIARIFEFQYHMLSAFSWSTLVDLGNNFVKCVLELSARPGQVNLPVMVISHGLGGIITKRALIILNENYYNPSCRGQLDLFTGLVFLGTPHPVYKKEIPTDQLDSLINASKTLSKEMLTTIREEVAFVWNVSIKFEEVNFGYGIVSAYETKLTKIPMGFFRSKREVLVNKSLATIRMRLEELAEVDADHHEICRVQHGSGVYDKILLVAKNVLGVARRFKAEPARSAVDVQEDWQSTPAVSIVKGMEATKARTSVTLSPIGATAGSSSKTSGNRTSSTMEHIVGTTPAVKLPCYILNQSEKYGNCIGRESILSMLDDALLPSQELNGSARNRELKTFAICGLGGLGKTAIASEFVSTRREQFDAVFFISASSENSLAEQFNNIALRLGLSQASDGDNRAVNRDKVLQWLNQPLKLPRNELSEDELPSTEEYANYLLVFDNADTPEILAEFWPVTGTGSILITSRDPHSKSHFYATRGIDLDSLSSDASANLLQLATGYTNSSEEESARRLAKRLGGLPLALTQVAGILQRRQLKFDEFLDFYSDPEFLAEVHQSDDQGLRSGYGHMLWNVWSFEGLRPESVRLLEVCSLLNPDHISEAIFYSGGTVTLEAFPCTPLLLDQARSELLKCSLLKRYPEEKEVVIHRVLQDAIRLRLDPKNMLKVFSSTINLLLSSWPSRSIAYSVEPQHWRVSETLIPHIESIRSLQQSIGRSCIDSVNSVVFVSLMTKTAWLLAERGLYEDAIPYTEAAESICNQYPQENAASLADLDFVISHNASYLHQWDLKLLHGERNVTYRLSLNNTTDGDWLSLGVAFNEMAKHYVEIGNWEKGMEAGEKALEAYSNVIMYKEKTQMPILPRVWIAWSYIGLQKPDDAEAMVLPCLEFLESSEYHWNFNPFRTGETLYALGNIRQVQGRLDESYELHQRAMNHYRSTIGKTHILTTKMYMKISEHCTRRGQDSDALKYIDMALESWSNRSIFEPHRTRAYSRKSLVLQSLGNPLKAEGLLIKAERLKANWLQAQRPLSTPGSLDDFDALVSCWEK